MQQTNPVSDRLSPRQRAVSRALASLQMAVQAEILLADVKEGRNAGVKQELKRQGDNHMTEAIMSIAEALDVKVSIDWQRPKGKRRKTKRAVKDKSTGATKGKQAAFPGDSTVKTGETHSKGAKGAQKDVNTH